MLQLLKTIQESDYKLNIEDVVNLIHYYKEIEEQELEFAYFQSTIEQARDISVMFNEKDLEIKEDEILLMKNGAKQFIKKVYYGKC
jgi:hypothetical protein